MSPEQSSVRQRVVVEDPLPGVNLAGYPDGHAGLAEVGRKLERVLEHAGIPFLSIPYQRPEALVAAGQREAAGFAPYDTNIVCLNADFLHSFMSEVTAQFFSNRYSIGVWFWETSIFGAEHTEGFRFLDEVWVASEYVRQVTSTEAAIPVVVAPLPLEAPLEPSITKGELGLPERFTFLFNFDFISVERKNPAAVVRAFTQAFAVDDEPVLVLKSINGLERKPAKLEELKRLVRGRPDIHVWDRYLSVDEKNALVAACDCYVSLHRSEGFGLTMAEAMTHGKPVIATGYSGNLEFMNGKNSYLVPYRLEPVPRDWWAYAPGAEWAEPDVGAASDLMRHVWQHRDEARAVGWRAREDLLERFSLERTAEFVKGRLGDARARGAVDARAATHDARPPILEASQELAAGVGDSLDARGSPPASLLRRFLRRALWPYLERQQRLETSMLDALTSLQRSVEDLQQRVLHLEGASGEESSTTGSEPERGSP